MIREMSTLDGLRFAVTRDQVSCTLAGESVILNLSRGMYYSLDPVGARVWALIQEPRTLAELRDTLSNEYDVDVDDLETDLRDLLRELDAYGLIDVDV
jgi:coenzyme PQQ synthesis protein D (PqqD)